MTVWTRRGFLGAACLAAPTSALAGGVSRAVSEEWSVDIGNRPRGRLGNRDGTIIARAAAGR